MAQWRAECKRSVARMLICSARSRQEERNGLDLHGYSYLVYPVNTCYIACMKQVITAKLKLLTTPDQFRALRRTQLAYRDALNYVRRYSFAHGKRATASVPKRDLADSAPVWVACADGLQCAAPGGRHLPGAVDQGQEEAEARRLGSTKKRYRGLEKAPRYVSPTLDLPIWAATIPSRPTSR